MEVRRYGLEDKVAALSRRLGLPVVTSFMGRGLLAEQDVPLVGTYMGVAGFPEVTQLVESSDGLFLLGEIICDTNFAVSETKIDMRKTIQALNSRVSIGYHTYANLPLISLVAVSYTHLDVYKRQTPSPGPWPRPDQRYRPSPR